MRVFNVGLLPSHDFASHVQPTAIHLVVQVSLVMFMLQGVTWAWSSVLPYMAIKEAYGVQVAVTVCGFATVCAGHAVGALFSVPALIPVRTMKIQPAKSTALQDLLRSMPLVALNFWIGAVLFGPTILLTTPPTELQDPYATLPAAEVLAAQALIFLLLGELWFFHAHKAMHDSKWMYAKFHKIHHTWTAPVALIATYAHPVEHVVSNLAALAIGPGVCNLLGIGGGVNILVLFSWALVGQIHTYAVHCGYWSDDLGFHDLHHEKFSCNYGIAGICDWLYGTYSSKGYSELLAQKRSADLKAFGTATKRD